MSVNKLSQKIADLGNRDLMFIKSREIVSALKGAGHEAYLVGGCVRNLLMGLGAKDYDIATSAYPEQVLELFPHSELVGAKFGVVIVKSRNFAIEVATYREEGDYHDKRRPGYVKYSTLENDVGRRDFTINAMYLDPVSGEIVDRCGGVRDIETRTVRCVGNPADRFDEDALRILRLLRFAAHYELRIARETWAAARELSYTVFEISSERIQEELKKGFSGAHPDRYMQLVYRIGILERIDEEFGKLEGCEQPAKFHPEGNVYVHTRMMLHCMKRYSTGKSALQVLFHDIGKPATFTQTDRIRFNGHDAVGADITGQALRRLRFSSEDIGDISNVVRHHMGYINYPQMKRGTKKKVLARKTIADEAELHRVDCLCSNQNFSTYREVMDDLQTAELNQEKALPKPFVSGRELIGWGLKPSAEFKQILDYLYELQLDGHEFDSEKGKEIVRKHFPSLKL